MVQLDKIRRFRAVGEVSKSSEMQQATRVKAITCRRLVADLTLIMFAVIIVINYSPHKVLGLNVAPVAATATETTFSPPGAPAARRPSGELEAEFLIENFKKSTPNEDEENLRKLKLDDLIKVMEDTKIKQERREQIYELINKPNSKESRRVVFDETIFTKRALESIRNKMNMSYEGESKSDPSIYWIITFNDTTILVMRSVNKYYYWTVGQTAGALIIFCMIVVGNLSILHRLKSCRRRRSNVNYFIVQLAIADLLVGIFSVTLDSLLRIQKAFTWGLFACRASKYISVLFIYSSTYLLVALSIDRWEAVVKPLAFTRNRSRGYHLVLAAWLLAFVSALPATYFTKIKEIDGLPQCWMDLDHTGWQYYMIYLTSLLLIVPTMIIAICYTHIVYTIWSKARLVAEQQRRLEDERLNRQLEHHRQQSRDKVAICATSQLKKCIKAASFRDPTSHRQTSDTGVRVTGNNLRICIEPNGIDGILANNNNNNSSNNNNNNNINNNSNNNGSNSSRRDQIGARDESVTSSEIEEGDEENFENQLGAPATNTINRITTNKAVNLKVSSSSSKSSTASLDSSTSSLCKQTNKRKSGAVTNELDLGGLGTMVADVGTSTTSPCDGSVVRVQTTATVGKENSVRTLTNDGFEMFSQRRTAKIAGGPDGKTMAAHVTPRPFDRRRTLSGGAETTTTATTISETISKPACARVTAARDQAYVTQQHGSGVIPKARVKTIKMTLVIVVAYILCWSPFLILNLCSVFDLITNNTNVSHALMTLTQSLAHLNSAVNPIIFWLFSSKRNQSNILPSSGTTNNTNSNKRNLSGTGHHRRILQLATSTSRQTTAATRCRHY